MESRVGKSIKNTVFGMVGLLISQIFSFIARSIFINILGVEYNGVNGLFSNILQVLSLAELGFATSIAYALYRPLKEHDEKTTAMLMNYFAKIYRIIALVVAVAGCCCIPFLQYLISEDISELSFSIGQLRIYFGMYLANTVCSYLLAYKRTIITADQNAYLVSNVDNLCNIGLNILQIILLYLTKSFYAFLGIMIAKTVLNNLILHLVAGKKYPYLANYKKEKLPKEEKTQLFKNVQAMFCHRIGGVVIYSTSSIIISAFVSLIDAGKYSNYLMVVTFVNAFISIIFNSVTASIGNLCIENDKKYQYIVFKRLSYLSDAISVFVFVCYVCLFNDFISLWVGQDMQFDLLTVIAISLSGMVTCLRKTVNAFRDATGIFRQDWYKPLIETAVAIGAAIGLSYIWGTFGVILGYTLATIFVAVPIEDVVLFRFGLQQKVRYQFIRTLVIIGIAAGLAALTYFICTFIPLGIGWFILKAIFVIVFSICLLVVMTFHTPEFKYYLSLSHRLLQKIFRRGKKPAEAGDSAMEAQADAFTAEQEAAVADAQAQSDTVAEEDASQSGPASADGEHSDGGAEGVAPAADKSSVIPRQT